MDNRFKTEMIIEDICLLKQLKLQILNKLCLKRLEPNKLTQSNRIKLN